VSETGEGKVFEEWVEEASVLGFEILLQPLEGSALKNLVGALHTDGGECMLLTGWEVKMKIPVQTRCSNEESKVLCISGGWSCALCAHYGLSD
jgi:hypothetical protein